MIRKASVSLSFIQENPTTKVSFGNNVIQQITGHAAVFPALPFTVMDLTTTNNTLGTAYDDYKLYGEIKKGDFVNALSVWDEKFSRTADYVELVADGNIAIYNQSGYSYTKTETTPAEAPLAPEPTMNVGNAKGVVQAKAKPVEGAKGFIFALKSAGMEVTVNGSQITVKAGAEVASFIIGTKRDVTFTNLPHADVEAQAAAFNSAGLGAFSDEVNVSIP